MDKQYFSNDPFLLENGSRKSYYGKIISQIIFRGGGKIFPCEVVDLMDEGQRGPHEMPRHIPPPYSPIEATKNKYKNTIHRREPDSVHSEMIDDVGEHTIVFNPNNTAERYGGAIAPREKDFTDDDCLCIAAISYQIGLSKHQGVGHFGEHLSVKNTENLVAKLPSGEEVKFEQLGATEFLNDNIEEWRSQLTNLLKRSLEKKPHVVCFPEFSLPPSDQNFNIHKIFANIISENAEKNVILFSGTCHTGVHNSGTVIAKRGHHLSHPLSHFKIASSRRLGENILGPRSNTIPIYTLPYTSAGTKRELRISVAICYDAFDPTVFLALLRDGITNSVSADPVSGKIPHRIILVPAFNQSSDFVEVLRDLSFSARCTVLYVNSAHGDATLFVSGIRLFDIANFQNCVNGDDDVNKFPNYINGYIRAFEDERDYLERKRQISAMSEDDLDLQSQISDLQKRIDCLSDFIEAFSEIDGDFVSNLITTEECIDECKVKSESVHPSCPHDILYFTIPHKLLDALYDFQHAYTLERELPDALKIATYAGAARMKL